MIKALTSIVAAVSISCVANACSSSITAEPWYPKTTRSDAARREHKDAADSDAGRNADDADSGE